VTLPYSVFPPRGPARARVLLPTGYAGSTASYPVIYLLHGAGDNPCAWTTSDDGQVPLEQFTAQREAQGERVIVVMSDGGGGNYAANGDRDAAGWYSNWCNPNSAGVCRFGAPAWETFHVEQLVAYVESHFRARPGRENRVVAGLSMGGFGSLSYAARHPDMFVSAYSFSGFANVDGLPFLEPTALAALQSRNNTPDARVWGDYTTNEVAWRGHNPADLAGNLRDLQRVWLRTGEGVAGGPAPDDGDPVGLVTEGAVSLTNHSFVVDATAAGLNPTYVPYPMGGHNWWHWQDDLHTAWPLMMADLAARPAPPAAFDYCSTEPAFSVWGWDVSATRTAAEFLSLQGAGRSGLTLRGSGAVTVATPAAYTAGAVYTVAATPLTTVPVTSAAGSNASASLTDPCVTPQVLARGAPQVQTAVAGPDGRLRFAITLGPAHAQQQFTPGERATETATPGYWQTLAVAITAGAGPAGGPGAAGGATPNTAGSAPAGPWAPLALVAAIAALVRREGARSRRSHASRPGPA